VSQTSPEGIGRPVVVTIHGIRTSGRWQKDIAPLLAERNCVPILLDYGYFNLAQFLWGPARVGRVRWLRDRLHEVRSRYPLSPVSVVAHSLGSYLVAGALELDPSLSLETVLFSGSIVRENYPWASLLSSRRVGYLANYVAGSDPWPRVAATLIGDAGASGVRGFTDRHVALFQHHTEAYRHSDYFNPSTFEGLWVPKLALPQRAILDVLWACADELRATFGDDFRLRFLLAEDRGVRFRTLPGMAVCGSPLSQYAADELSYVLLGRSDARALPPAFGGAAAGRIASWSRVVDGPALVGRRDLSAAVAAPVFGRGGGVAGILSVEIVGVEVHNLSDLIEIAEGCAGDVSRLEGCRHG
jgi:hypothetical protein